MAARLRISLLAAVRIFSDSNLISVSLHNNACTGRYAASHVVGFQSKRVEPQARDGMQDNVTDWMGRFTSPVPNFKPPLLNLCQSFNYTPRKGRDGGKYCYHLVICIARGIQGGRSRHALKVEAVDGQDVYANKQGASLTFYNVMKRVSHVVMF
jgi:hypothetical protein